MWPAALPAARGRPPRSMRSSRPDAWCSQPANRGDRWRSIGKSSQVILIALRPPHVQRLKQWSTTWSISNTNGSATSWGRIKQPVRRLVREATKLLLDRISRTSRGDELPRPRTVTVDPRFVVRDSVGVPRSSRRPPGLYVLNNESDN